MASRFVVSSSPRGTLSRTTATQTRAGVFEDQTPLPGMRSFSIIDSRGHVLRRIEGPVESFSAYDIEMFWQWLDCRDGTTSPLRIL